MCRDRNKEYKYGNLLRMWQNKQGQRREVGILCKLEQCANRPNQKNLFL